MNTNLQKMGGVSALIAAATFMFGFVLFFTLLIPVGYFDTDTDPIEKVAFLVDNQSIMYLFNLIIYVVFGVMLVVLALALYERLKGRTPALAQIATSFGLIWAVLVIASGMVANVGASVVIALYGENVAQAASAWIALDIVVRGLGGGNEIVGGLWVLLVSWAALRAGVLPRGLNCLGVVVGVAGIITTIPVVAALEVFGAIFGLCLIVWFVWLGIIIMRSCQIGCYQNSVR